MTHSIRSSYQYPSGTADGLRSQGLHCIALHPTRLTTWSRPRAGPSGSGKSLLLRTIAGFEPASKDRRPGTVTLAGRTPSEWGIPAWRARVSYVSQSRPTITGTPRELHTAAAGLAAQRARQGLTLVYFSAQLERFACDRGCA